MMDEVVCRMRAYHALGIPRGCLNLGGATRLQGARSDVDKFRLDARRAIFVCLSICYLLFSIIRLVAYAAKVNLNDCDWVTATGGESDLCVEEKDDGRRAGRW